MCTYVCSLNVPLYCAVNSFVDMARYLLSQGQDSLFVLSERISQDPLELELEVDVMTIPVFSSVSIM